MKEDWMKKLLVVLLALTACCGLAFAQDAPAMTLSGSMDTGIKVFSDYSLNGTGYIWETNNGYPSDLWLDYTINGTKAGGFFELCATEIATGNIYTDSLYGWWKPIDMLTIKAGLGYGDVYSTPIEGWDNGSTGLQISIAPIEGLVAAIDYPFTASGTAEGIALGNLKVAASYTLASIVALGVNCDFGAGQYIAGVNVLAVKDLTAQAEIKFLSADSTMRAEEYFAYAIGALKPYLWAYEDTIGTVLWGAKLGAGYTIETVTPGAYFQYNADASWAGGVYASFTVEKNAIKAYADIKSTNIFDVGFRYVLSF
jgi:hypothetical protein